MLVVDSYVHHHLNHSHLTVSGSNNPWPLAMWMKHWYYLSVRECFVGVWWNRNVFLRYRQEITWTFGCPIAPYFWSHLNREIRDVEQLRLWFRSIESDQISSTVGPQTLQLTYLSGSLEDSMWCNPVTSNPYSGIKASSDWYAPMLDWDGRQTNAL